MRRRAVAVVALTIALATAGTGIALALAAAGGTDAAPAASPSASPSIAVTADDYCYVEAMIYYRVEESELAETLLRKDGLDTGARAALRSQLADRSMEGQQKLVATLRNDLARVNAIDAAQLSFAMRTSVEVVRSAYATSLEGFALPYGDITVGSWRNTPYVVIQTAFEPWNALASSAREPPWWRRTSRDGAKRSSSRSQLPTTDIGQTSRVGRLSSGAICRRWSRNAIVWIVLPRPMSSARQPPSPSRASPAIQVSPRSW